MSDVKLMLGDCLDVLPTLSGIDAVVSDPPYGMNWNTDSRRFSKGNTGLWDLKGAGRDRPRIIGDSAPFSPDTWVSFPKVVLWGANHYAARLPTGTTLVWVKKRDEMFGTFLSDAEIAWMRGGHGVYCFRRNFATPTRRKEGGGEAAHPNQKPVALMRWCIERLKLKPGSTILDPYMGSGTTGVAAVELGFNFIGVEIDPTHFATAERRIEAARNSTPLFAGATA